MTATQMIIDIHGHYTTTPKELGDYRDQQKAELKKNPQAQSQKGTLKISDDQLFYCLARGIGAEEAVALIVNGFCRDVLQQLPMEFAVEAQKLVGISLEGSVG